MEPASALGTSDAFMLVQLINMIILALMISVPVAFMVYVVRKLGRKTNPQTMLVKQFESDSYIQVDFDDVQKIDIVDRQQAIIHTRNNQKIAVRGRDGRKLVRKLKT